LNPNLSDLKALFSWAEHYNRKFLYSLQKSYSVLFISSSRGWGRKL